MYACRMVAVLDEMERLKLVERKASPNDRRFYALHLTERGKEKLQAIGKVAREHREAMCAGAQRGGTEHPGSVAAKNCRTTATN